MTDSDDSRIWEIRELRKQMAKMPSADAHGKLDLVSSMYFALDRNYEELRDWAARFQDRSGSFDKEEPRFTASSRLSPGSTNPASTEYHFFGHAACRPSNTRSP